MVRPLYRKREGDAATTTRDAEHRGAPPSRHTFRPGDRMGEDGGGREARIGAGGHGGGGMGSGPGRAEGWGRGWVLASCFPCSGAFCFLSFCWRAGGPTMTGQAGPCRGKRVQSPLVISILCISTTPLYACWSWSRTDLYGSNPLSLQA